MWGWLYPGLSSKAGAKYKQDGTFRTVMFPTMLLRSMMELEPSFSQLLKVLALLTAHS